MNRLPRNETYVELFTAPVCEGCRRAEDMLARRGLRYREIDVSRAQGRAEMALRLPHVDSIPQIFIDGRHIGGLEELERLDVSGGLGLVERRGALH